MKKIYSRRSGTFLKGTSRFKFSIPGDQGRFIRHCLFGLVWFTMNPAWVEEI